MPPISGRLHSLLKQYIYLFLSYVFGRPISLLTIPIVNHRNLQPPRSCKRKALLVGVEYPPTTRRRRRPVRPLNLKGPHRDVWNMRQFLIGGFKFSTSKECFGRLPAISLADRWHYDPEDIILLMNTDDPKTVQPTRENIVWFGF